MTGEPYRLTSRWLWSFNWLGAVISLLGCVPWGNGRAQQLGLVPISGLVELDGVPVESAIVILEHEDGSHSRATTDSSGHFQMMFDSETPGVLPGPKVVRISKYDIPSGQTVEPEDYETMSRNLIPAQYNRKSKLKQLISSETDFLKFELKSADSK